MEGTVDAMASELPMVLRLTVGSVGLLLLLFGARLYNVALFGSAFVAGAAGAATLCLKLGSMVPALSGTGAVLVCGILGGAVLSGLAKVAHRWMLVLAGGAVGLLSGIVVAAEFAFLPVWTPVATLLVGGLAMPPLYRQLLKLITPLFGATALVWALGRMDSLAWLVGLWVLGALVQVRGGLGTEDDPGEDEA